MMPLFSVHKEKAAAKRFRREASCKIGILKEQAFTYRIKYNKNERLRQWVSHHF
jgi:ribosomal protein L35